ncbi:universal stress protein [Ruania rhizosphaerae]|uniref:universal stress protein n=1 Tax=Ruania rhizosphaerae TaxID=1840413 RepID=UPI00135BA95F|nr:universal stress protein [Ruania rhizosphaerae]
MQNDIGGSSNSHDDIAATAAGPAMYVVGIDGSASSRGALSWALQRARSSGAALTLVAIVDAEWAAVSEELFTQLHSTVSARVESELNWARLAEPTVTITARVQIGAPMPRLADAAAGTQLLVVGTHKSGYIRGKALGARSVQLALRTTTPVAVVPRLGERSRSGVVVAGAGGGAGSAIAFAARESARRGEPLIVVCSSPPADRDRVLEHARRQALAVAPEVEIRTRWTEQDPAELLIALSSSTLTTVIGKRSGTEARLGRIAIEVLMNLAGPVIIVPGA